MEVKGILNKNVDDFLAGMLENSKTELITAESEMKEWLMQLNQQYEPRRLVFAISSEVACLPGALSAYAAPESGVLAYVCQAGRCLAPVSELRDLLKEED